LQRFPKILAIRSRLSLTCLMLHIFQILETC